MSDTGAPPPPDPSQPRAPPAIDSPRGCLTIFLVTTGILLLLPGLCTAVIFGSEFKKPNVTLPPFVTLLFGIALLGAVLAIVGIVIALNGLRRRR